MKPLTIIQNSFLKSQRAVYLSLKNLFRFIRMIIFGCSLFVLFFTYFKMDVHDKVRGNNCTA